MAPLRFAFLGAWHSHAVLHVRDAARWPHEFELLGFYDPDPQVVTSNRARWAQDPGIEVPALPDADAVLNGPAEAVVVDGHVYQNLDYAEAALQAGKHVLLEKPAGVDLAHYERLQRLAADRGLQLHLGYMWRYSPAITEMLRLAREGHLGQVFQFRGHIPKPKSWHPQLAEEFGLFHGGVYFEMAGHLVDLMVTLLGEPHTVRPTLSRHYGDRAHIDNAVVVHETADGIGIVDTTGMQVGMDRRIEVHGTSGTVLHEPLASPNLRAFLEDGDGDWPAGQWAERQFPETDGTQTLLRELAACIRGERDHVVTAAHDLAVQRTLLRGCDVDDGLALQAEPPV